MTPKETQMAQDIQPIVRGAIEEALDWRREHIDPKIEEATDYYMGRPFGDERAGRSKVVLTTVRDTVQAILPSMLRIFFGPESVVEFKPRRPDAQPLAEQQTDYINLVVREDNAGFTTFYALFKDALVRKMGIATWWWDERVVIEGSSHSGLTEEDIQALLSDEGVEVEELTEATAAVMDLDPATGMEVVVSPALYDLTIKRTTKDGHVCIEAIPPEEFIFSPSARSLADARMVGRVRDVPGDELVAMGFDPELVEEHLGSQADVGDGEGLEAARRVDYGARNLFEDEQFEATRPVRFADLYMMVPAENGLAELRHIQAIGESYEIVTNEPADQKPFALFCPDPEPHTLVGLSTADYVMDLQRITSSVTRGVLDSLSLTLNPATEVVDRFVNMKDVLNPEVGRIIRVQQPGMMREVVTPFVGREAMPVLQWLDGIRESRVGLSKASAGLDADALQSSTKAAVAATLSAAQQRIEVIARIFSETGMKDLFRGVMKLIVRHQDKPRVVRLRGQYVEVDPRHWDADMDVVVNVALGVGLPEEKIQTLALIADKQEQLLLQGAPLVGLSQYRNTLGRMVELSGFKNSDEFFLPWTPEQDQEMAQAKAQQPPEPSEVQALLQIEQMKVQAQMEQAKIQAEIDMTKIRLEDERERYKITTDAALKKAAIEAKFQTDVTNAEIKAEQLRLDAVVEGANTGMKLADIASSTGDMHIDTENMGI